MYSGSRYQNLRARTIRPSIVKHSLRGSTRMNSYDILLNYGLLRSFGYSIYLENDA